MYRCYAEPTVETNSQLIFPCSYVPLLCWANCGDQLSTRFPLQICTVVMMSSLWRPTPNSFSPAAMYHCYAEPTVETNSQLFNPPAAMYLCTYEPVLCWAHCGLWRPNLNSFTPAAMYRCYAEPSVETNSQLVFPWSYVPLLCWARCGYQLSTRFPLQLCTVIMLSPLWGPTPNSLTPVAIYRCYAEPTVGTNNQLVFPCSCVPLLCWAHCGGKLVSPCCTLCTRAVQTSGRVVCSTDHVTSWKGNHKCM